ncbi:MAG TPA: hypothetical protein VEG39_20210 [Clostridia bacterium]|nr:hypothetical protein [Clostridia bacterium]
MWETIKNNVLLKTITIVILGVLGFGLAFDIMFGRNAGMMGEGMNSGYALESTLAYILIILIKLFLIALVLVALTAVCKSGKKYLFEGGDIKVFESIKNDPIMKIASVIIASVLCIALIIILFGNIFGGFGVTPNYYYSMGVSGGLGLVPLLVFLLRLLFAISIVGLVASVTFYIIQNPSRLSNNKTISTSSKMESNYVCIRCGMALKPDWKCCPNCGEEKKVCSTSESAPAADIIAAEEDNHTEITSDEKAVKEDLVGESYSKDSVEVYDKLYDIPTEELKDNATYIKSRKKQNKR